MSEKNSFIRGIVGWAAVWMFVASATAQEVTIEHNGLTLNAELVLAEEKSMADGIVLLTHGTLAHNRMEIIAGLQGLLADSGVSTLAINLSLGLDNRRGMYDCSVLHNHRHQDAVGEMVAWLDWLEAQGARQIDLMGHSRGGNQIAWLAAEQDRPAIRKVVLLAPATWSAGGSKVDYKKRYKEALEPLVNEAEMYVGFGRGDVLLKETDFIYCADTTVTADAFFSYYKPDDRLHTPNLLPQINKPILVIAATEDKLYVPLKRDISPMVGSGVDFLAVEGAGHFFRDLYLEEVVEQTVEWLER